MNMAVKKGNGVVTIAAIVAATELVVSHLLYNDLVPFQVQGWMLHASYVVVISSFLLFYAGQHSIVSNDYDAVAHREIRPRAGILAFTIFLFIGVIVLVRATLFVCFSGYEGEIDCYIVGVWPSEEWTRMHSGLGRRESMALAHFEAQEIYGYQYAFVLVLYVSAYLALLASIVWWAGRLFIASADRDANP